MGFDVNGKTALVTGSNRGIGKAIVEGLLSHGAAKVYAGARNPDSLSGLVDSSGGKVVPVPLDLERNETIEDAAKHDEIQLVINNAGVLRPAKLLEPDAEDALRFETEVNVIGLMRMARAFAPVLARNGGGAFVQINSIVSIKTFPDFSTYCASKAASYAITQALREILGAQGTQVLSVHPGPIATEMADSAGLTEMAEPPSVVAETLIEALADGRFLAFPDKLAKSMGEPYLSFARSVVESGGGEG